MGAGQSGRDGDEASAQGGAASHRVCTAGQDAGGAQQVVGDGRAQYPGRVRPETSRGHVGQGSVDEVGEHGFDDRVAAVSDVSDVDGFVGVGEERVISPDREQGVGVSGVFDPAHDQPCRDRSLRGTESGVGGFGDFGIGDPGTGVGIAAG